MDFASSVNTLVRVHAAGQEQIKQLLAENEKMRRTLAEYEEQMASDADIASSKRLRQDSPEPRASECGALLHANRLVSPMATSHWGEEDESLKKAEFKLIAHSGQDREEICPQSRDITLPVLVKSYVEFVWNSKPKCALVMLRPGDALSLVALKQVAQYLLKRGIRLIVEPGVPELAGVEPTAMLARVCHGELHHQPIDFIVTLGGDGTFIHAADAFPKACPPILAFAFGSLGFLTPFPSSTMIDSLDYVMDEVVGLRLRARLEVEVTRQGFPTQVYQVLNECVIDRGISSSLVRLMLYSNRDGRQPVTIVQGDGLILASPTGSTAYSLSAGGSMVHPSVPAILVTPICPHSLSFRPILVPDSATLRVQVALDARNSAYLSLDGKPGMEMKQGDEFTIRYSSFPVPAIMSRRTSQGDSDGWLSSLRTALNWNAMQVTQKPL